MPIDSISLSFSSGVMSSFIFLSGARTFIGWGSNVITIDVPFISPALSVTIERIFL